MTRRPSIFPCLAAACLAMAGCSASPNGTSGHTTAPATSIVVQNSLPPPASIANNPDLRPHVIVTSCDAVDGGWSATGTVTNPLATSRTYDITVFFTTSSATVEDFATTTVRVGPASTVSWSASKSFAAVPGTLCVLRGVG